MSTNNRIPIISDETNDNRISNPELELSMTVFLVIEYAVLPVVLIILHRLVMTQVPKKEMCFLFFSITTWSWIGVFIVMFGTNVYCHEPQCGFFGGLWNIGNIVSMIMFSSISFMISLLELFYGWSFTCGLSDVHQPLPVELKSSSVDLVKDITERIKATGPTLIAGNVIEKSSINYQRGKTTFWKLGYWEQFLYDSWVNEESPDNLKKQGFDSIEEVFRYSKPMVIKICLSVFPANEESKQKYNQWLCQLPYTTESNKDTKIFTEEFVTDQTFWNKHEPSQLVPSAQFPCLVQQTTKVTNLANKPMLDHVMLAKDRLICENPPCWMAKTAYAVATVLLLGPVYRTFYWINVKVIRLKFRKLFNTEKSCNSSQKHAGPFVNNIEGFRLKQFK